MHKTDTFRSQSQNEHDIVARILRKENYLLGMLNRDVLGLRFQGMRGVGNGTRQNKVWFTKTIEYHIHQVSISHFHIPRLIAHTRLTFLFLQRSAF